MELTTSIIEELDPLVRWLGPASVGLEVRMFVPHAEGQGSNPGCDKPESLK